MNDYIYFEKIECKREKRKTDIYNIMARNENIEQPLGEIKWYGPWRQYCFLPNHGTVWSTGCLLDVDTFIRKLMEGRKKK